MSVRRVNEPQRAAVTLGVDGRPKTVAWASGGGRTQRSRRATVEHVIESWHVDDLWWTHEPVRRACYECQLDEGTRIVIVYDIAAARWYVQR